MGSPRLCQTYPTNLAILGAFTIAESWIVSSICSMYTPESILLSAVATAAATFGITFYAFVTKSDFTKWMSSFYGTNYIIKHMHLEYSGFSYSLVYSTSLYLEANLPITQWHSLSPLSTVDIF